MFSKSRKIIILFEIILKFLLISGQTEENCWGQCLCYDFTIRCVLVNFQSVPNNFSRQTKTLWVVLCKCISITTFSSCILFKAIYPGAGDPGGLGAHNALKSTVNRKGQKRRIWLLPTQTLSYGEPKFIVILLPCHTTMLKSHIMKYFTFEINLLGEKWKFCNFSFRPPRNALKVLK